MAAEEDHSDFLASWVQHGKNVMTYRLMSRELRIHVDQAKKSMQAYYDATRGDSNPPHATFVVIGQLRLDKQEEDVEMEDASAQDSQGSDVAMKGSAHSFLSDKIKDKQLEQDAPSHGILLSSDSRLEETKAKFTSITSTHIYSLQPGPLKDAAVLTNVQHELHTNQKYLDVWAETGRGKELGVILNEGIKDNYDPTKHLPSLAGPSAPALPPRKDDKKQTQPKSEPVKKEEAKPAAAESKSSSGAKKGGLDWSRAKAKDAKPAAKGTKRKNHSDEDEASVVSGEEDLGPSRRNGKGRPSNPRAALLGEDDDDDGGKLGYDVEEEEEKAASKTKPGKTKTAKRADASKKTKEEEERQKKALEDMMDVDDDPDVPTAAEPSTSTMKGTAEADEAKPKRRVRKQRSIGKKKVRRKDDRGYMVTEMVDEYESYSSDESDAPPAKPASKAKAATTTDEPKKSSSGLTRKPSTGGGAPAKKGQQSLSSFFTKKTK